MGDGLKLGEIIIDETENTAFSTTYDPNRAHVTGLPNGVLPERSVSGILLVSRMMRLLVDHVGDDLVCASRASIEWHRPVQVGDVLIVRLTTYPSMRGAVQSVVAARGDVPVCSITVRQYLAEKS